MFAYGERVMADRRVNPRKDLMTAIANTEMAGKPLPQEYLDGSWLLIIFAGNDTSRNSLSGTIRLLTQFPDLVTQAHGVILTNPTLRSDGTLRPRFGAHVRQFESVTNLVKLQLSTRPDMLPLTLEELDSRSCVRPALLKRFQDMEWAAGAPFLPFVKINAGTAAEPVPAPVPRNPE